MQQELTPVGLVAEIELTYKSKVKASARISIKSSQDAYKVLIDHWDKDKIELVEQFKVLLLNNANQLLGIYNLSTGGVRGTIADARLIFAAALKANACNLILAHNHPSGNLTPSHADKEVTRKLTEAGNLMDIKVIDHLIVTVDGYYSFGEAIGL